MSRFVNPGKRIASLTRTFARMRWALNFDGVGIRGVLANRAINPDGDIDIEFYAPNTINAPLCIISQNKSNNSVNMEFRLLSFSNQLQLLVGGAVTVALTGAQGYEASAKYRVTLIGTALTVYKNGDLVRSATFTRGTAREADALTVVGAETNNAIGVYQKFFSGIQRDIKINGTLWPIADRNQAIQLPEPSGLGADDIGADAFATPVGYDNITSGTANSAVVAGEISPSRAAKAFLTPVSSYLVECILNSTTSPITMFIRDGSTAGNGTVIASQILTPGLNRLLFNRISGNANILFTTGVAANFSVSNISVRQLGTCNPMTITGANNTNWVEQSI